MGIEVVRALMATLQEYTGTDAIPTNAVNLTEFSGAVGDGVVDDTLCVQRALTYCSDNSLPLYLPPHRRYLITRDVYFWGGISLIGSVGSAFYINANLPYIFNVGIKGRQILADKWTGKIEGVTFRVVGSGSGRLLFFWRAEGATIRKNVFHLGESSYGPMSSGNNNNYVINGQINCIRKNITITENQIFAQTDQFGSEGIGLNQWDGATIAGNVVHGVADDMIGLHYCNNIQVYDNTLSGTDGRLFVANSRNITVKNNDVSRMASVATGTWHTGIALIYIGHEADVTNSNYAPENITVENNRLVYPLGSKDLGSAIYVYSPRNVVIKNNTVTSHAVEGANVGIYLLPFQYVAGTWTDPTGVDTGNISRVHKVTIDGNNCSAGTRGMKVQMTGSSCALYAGPVTFTNNKAGAYQFICNPTVSGNITMGS